MADEDSSDEAPLGAGQLAALLQADIKTVHQWTQKGLIPIGFFTPGGQAKYYPSEVKAEYDRQGRALPRPFKAFIEGGASGRSMAAHAVKRAHTRMLLDELATRRANGDPLLAALGTPLWTSEAV